MDDDSRLVSSSAVRPSLPIRLLGAIPLLFLYIIFFTLLDVTSRFEAIFKEMDLGGGSSLLTQFTFALASTGVQFWYLLMPIMFVLAWLFFAWGCKTQTRMLWCSFGTAVVAVLLFLCGVYGFYWPLVTIVEKIGSR